MSIIPLSIDFAKSAGAIRPLHGVDCAPYSKNDRGAFATKMFTEAKIPYCRLHDCMGSYGGAHYVDIPNIFPNFDADENDPANYDFYMTDDYIAAIVRAGTKVVYRLGITIDWGYHKYHTMPPQDYGKWARICEHVIRHYNEGWANGYTWGITDWEIWNEPENPPMWSGTREEYFALYTVAAKHLKDCFPHLKIGGYGSCGFYAVTRDHVDDFFRSFVPYFTDFLDYITRHGAPLDFFSWHIYNDDPIEVLEHAKFVRKTLDEKGFPHTESSLNEWNYGAEGHSHLEKKTMVGATYVASVLSTLQDSGIVDTAMYYDASAQCTYNGLFRMEDHKYMKPFYVLCAWGELWSLGQYHPVLHGDDTSGIYATAASGNGKAGILFCNPTDGAATVEVRLTGLVPGQVLRTYLLDNDHDMVPMRTEIFRGDELLPVWELPAKAVLYVTLEKE